MSNLFYRGKENFPSMNFLLIMFGSTAVDIGLYYGLTSPPYPRPFYLQFPQPSLSQTSCQYHAYVYFHGNNCKNSQSDLIIVYNNNSITPINPTITGMNPSFFTHVLSTNIFFLLSINISITMFP